MLHYAAPLLTAKDVAHYCQVSVRTIRRWRRNGHLPAPLQIGGSLRWRATDIQTWLIDSCPHSVKDSVNPDMAIED